MSDYTRRQLLGRGAMGASVLTLPGLLAACGGSGGIKGAANTGAATQVTRKLAKTLNFSNWPLYIDVDEKTKRHPSLDDFTKKFGVNVKYTEDINDNPSFFGKIQGPLARGQSIGRDLIVMTDSSGFPGRMIKLGWLEKLDKPSIPNIKNLLDVQQHPSWDPNRDYSLPWQSGMTGIGYDPNKVGGELTSVQDLLTNPKLKGKVTLLSELADSVGLVMLANGDDPAKVSGPAYDKAIATMKKAVDSGQVRQFTGNDYAPLLAKGDVWACFAWSGDMVQLQADHPHLKWNLPDSGGMIWTDNMLIPKGGNVYTASVYMNYYYTPAVAAKVEDYVNYICPVKGADEVLKKTDPGVAKNPLIFPTQEMLSNVKQFDSQAAQNVEFKTKFAQLTGS
ncbi:MAG TPA: spermidine/putrescine ABC transporter substrate-binding protein [Thermoleophilaceae bacterium]|nr:spermidine/putrescine ABC transporter substrate-binding protein [Thermoleophilaceae bacterium]